MLHTIFASNAERTLIYLCTVLTYARVITSTWMTHGRQASLGKNMIRSPLDVARLTVIWTTSTYSIRALDWTTEAWSPTIGTRVCAAIECARTITIQGSPGDTVRSNATRHWFHFHRGYRSILKFRDSLTSSMTTMKYCLIQIFRTASKSIKTRNFFVLSMLHFSCHLSLFLW